MREHERLLVACSLATRVECSPVRRDGSVSATYKSSGPTLARRLTADPSSLLEVTAAIPPGPGPFYWDVRVKAGMARQTRYRIWLSESPGQVDDILAQRKRAEELRASLPHGERKKKPWGPL